MSDLEQAVVHRLDRCSIDGPGAVAYAHVMANESEADEPYDYAGAILSKYSSFNRKLNNAAVFIALALPILTKAEPIAADRKARGFKVPTTTGFGNIIRKNSEVKAIYEQGISRQIFESYLLTAVSQFETLAFDILELVLLAHPIKLLQPSEDGKNQNKGAEMSVSFKSVVNESRDEIIKAKIKAKLLNVSYAKPADYLAYIKKITNAETDTLLFHRYIEIKATRDIVVHNGGIANEIYKEKVGKYARANVGELLTVDEAYFNKALGIIKRAANTIQEAAATTVADEQETPESDAD